MIYSQFSSIIQRSAVSTLALLGFTASLAVIFSLAVSSTGLAGGPPTCDVCHKRTTTFTLPCASLEYRRHLDHGDPPMACAATLTAIDVPVKIGAIAPAPIVVGPPISEDN